jgi:hypothetical protein
VNCLTIDCHIKLGGQHIAASDCVLLCKEIQLLIGALVDQFDVKLVEEPVWFGVGPVLNVGVEIRHLPIELTSRA